VNPAAPVTRRSKSLSAQLGLTERLFASSADRNMAATLDEGLALVEEGLLRELSFGDHMADVTSRYLFAAGGKRVRPMLTLLTAQLGDGNVPEVLLAAQAIEITHLASLYHDDVMDEAEQRRGVPSAQTVWGNSIAILTGDLLFARASKLVAALGERAIVLQAETFERLVLGQLHETAGPQPEDDPIEHYIGVLAGKTGSLIAAAAQMGVVFSHAPEHYEDAVMLFGERIGVAFQLIDDVLDLSPRAEETGKLAGTDLKAGVPTLPLLYLRRLAGGDDAAASLLARIDHGIASDDSPEFQDAVEELRQHEVTQITVDEALRWARDAVAALEPLPDGPVKKALTRFADVMVERSN